MHWLSRVCLLGLLATPLAAADKLPRTQAQAQLLDHAEMLCSDCFFGASYHYFCFADNDKILIGYQKVPVVNFMDKSKNYMEPAHPAWSVWTAPGATIPLSYDDKHIYLSRTESKNGQPSFWSYLKNFGIWATHGKAKDVRLTRNTMGDIFATDARCRAVR